MATTVKGADQYKCWKDFSGKPVYFTQAGFQNWLNWQRIFKALGYDFKHVQIDNKANGDALEQGTIVGSAIYTTAGRSLAALLEGDRGPHGHQGRSTRVRTRSPSSRRPGSRSPASKRKTRSPRASDPRPCRVCRSCSATTCAPDMSEAIVYKMIKAFYDKRDELVKIEAGFIPMAKDFVGMQAQGINANPTIPVHAGLAKFMKEHKAWDDKWKVSAGGS